MKTEAAGQVWCRSGVGQYHVSVNGNVVFVNHASGQAWSGWLFEGPDGEIYSIDNVADVRQKLNELYPLKETINE